MSWNVGMRPYGPMAREAWLPTAGGRRASNPACVHTWRRCRTFSIKKTFDTQIPPNSASTLGGCKLQSVRVQIERGARRGTPSFWAKIALSHRRLSSLLASGFAKMRDCRLWCGFAKSFLDVCVRQTRNRRVFGLLECFEAL